MAYPIFNIKQLTAIALILNEEEKKKKFSGKKKGVWIYKSLTNRISGGGYWTLYNELKDDK